MRLRLRFSASRPLNGGAGGKKSVERWTRSSHPERHTLEQMRDAADQQAFVIDHLHRLARSGIKRATPRECVHGVVARSVFLHRALGARASRSNPRSAALSRDRQIIEDIDESHRARVTRRRQK